MERSAKFLGIAAVIFKVLAWVSAVFFLVVALIVLFGAGGPDTPRVASLIFILGGALYFLLLFSIAEAFKILAALYEKVTALEGSSNTDSSGNIQDLNKKVDRLLSLLEGKPTKI